MKKNERNILLIIIISILMATLASLEMKVNFLVILLFIIIIMLASFFIYISEKRLFYFTFWGTIISTFLSNYASVMSYYMYFSIILISIKLFEKKFIRKQKIIYDKVIISLSMILLLINIISLFYNNYKISFILAIFYILKRFSYVVLYLFFMNMNIDKRVLSKNVKLLLVYAIIQIPIILLQFLSGNIHQDNITGLFGISNTGPVLQYLIIIMCIVTVFNNNKFFSRCFELGMVVYILLYSAVAEVKLGFIITPIIYLLILLLQRKYFKFSAMIAVILIVFVNVYSLFNMLYPDQDFFNSSSYTKSYLESAYYGGTLNRVGFMEKIEGTVLDTSYKKLFGTGLGTGNRSKVSILEGPVFRQYRTMNIDFFTLPYSIIENGIVGTCIWIGVYIYILLKYFLKYLLDKNNKKNILIIIIGIVTLSFMFYNNSMTQTNFIILITWLVISICNEKIKCLMGG